MSVLHKNLLAAACMCLCCAAVSLYAKAEPLQRIIVDQNGVMRWKDTNQEVALFGVNYCFPSAYGFRMAGLQGIDRKAVVDADMLHLARMGLDAVRLSFWGDWENSQRDGTLADNEHLDLLDYTVWKASSRGIYMMLTPIVLYSPVWPLPEETNTCQGFARFYPKNRMGLDPAALQAQRKYLSQLMAHVNRYTGIAYKDDPAIAVVEPVNEPYHHPETNPVEYINALVTSVRDTGYAGPIVFNVSQDMAMASAIRDSLAQGATFGWYPSGLVNGRSLVVNFLPRVNDYRPMYDPLLKNKAKLVYEFDAADVPGSYLYPAMARTYRSAGVQFAAMFSYDPVALAWSNLEYQTHYMNLMYASNKAVSLMIAAEAFRRLPRMQSYGDYPANTRFGPVRVDYERDTSEFITDSLWMYSNSTKTTVDDASKLERVIGCGSSQAVEYAGTGVYFLEKMQNGIWRLEVYPDAVWIRDPYGRPSQDREVSRLIYRSRKMKIALPDLGMDFKFTALNASGQASGGEINVEPGIYRLTNARSPTGRASDSELLMPDEFLVPPKKAHVAYVAHTPPSEIVEGQNFTVSALVASDREPREVRLAYRLGETSKFTEVPMQRTSAYDYAATIAGAQLEAGLLEYAITVVEDEKTTIFPGQSPWLPSGETGAAKRAVLYSAGDRAVPPLQQWSAKEASVSIDASEKDRPVLKVQTKGFDANGSMNVNLAFAGQAVHGETPAYGRAEIVIAARASTAATTCMEMVLLDRFGMSRNVVVPLEAAWKEHHVKLEDVCIENLASAKLSIGTWLFPGYDGSACGFELQSIEVLEPDDVWTVAVVPSASPLVLLDAADDQQELIFPNSEHKVAFSRSVVRGMNASSSALRVDVGTFRYSPHDVSFRKICEFAPDRLKSGRYTQIILRARAGVKETTSLELALIARNGAVRSIEVPLTAQWQDINITIHKLNPGVVAFLPRPYPTQFDYWDQDGRTNPIEFDIVNLQAVQVSFGSRLFPKWTDHPHAIEIESIVLK